MILSTSIIALVLVATVTSQCLDTKNAIPYSIGKAEQIFSLNLLNTVVSSYPGQSVFFSPYSTYHALMLAYFSSANQTEVALKRTLQIDDTSSKPDVYRGYKLEQQNLLYRQDKDYDFTSSDRLYIANSVQIRDCIADVFQSEIIPTNFRENPQEIRSSINEWVSNETRGHIKDLLPAQAITANTDLVLVNAAYFKGTWHSKFEVADTKKAIFYGQGSENYVDMMRQEATFRHLASETLKAQILDMPYSGDDISMIVILPTSEADSVESLLAKLNPIELTQLLAEEEGIERTVEVQFPKLSIEKSIELKPILVQLGVGDLFEPTADLTSLAPGGGVHLDDAIHKAKVEVDENGAVAAAATALFSFRSSRPAEPAQFICNHPFLYMLYDRTLKSILFMGVYRGPNV